MHDLGNFILRFMTLALLATPASAVHATVSDAGRSRTPPCAIAPATFLNPRTWGDFDKLHSETDRVSPFATFAIPTGRPSPLITDFQVSRLQGLVTTLVLHGKYRAENDAYARSLGYTPGRTPLVPLVGTIVRDHPGVLEVYETHWLWRSARGASAHMRSIRGSGKDGEVERQMALHVGDDSYAYVVRPTETDGQHEWSVGIAIRVRTTVVTLTLRGGRQLDSNTLERLGHRIVVRISRCET